MRRKQEQKDKERADIARAATFDSDNIYLIVLALLEVAITIEEAGEEIADAIEDK
jgi:hypothetical protein